MRESCGRWHAGGSSPRKRARRGVPGSAGGGDFGFQCRVGDIFADDEIDLDGEPEVFDAGEDRREVFQFQARTFQREVDVGRGAGHAAGLGTEKDRPDDPRLGGEGGADAIAGADRQAVVAGSVRNGRGGHGSEARALRVSRA